MENGIEPDRLTLWDITHKRKDGSYVNEEVQSKLEEAFNFQLQEASLSATSDQSEINEKAFKKVYGAEHNGRVRGLGLGPTPSSYFGVTSKFVSSSGSSNNMDQEAEMKNVKDELIEMKAKYAKLSTEFDDMKSRIRFLMAEKGAAGTSFNEVGDAASN